MIPVAGSAYTYSYATMGEFMAWIIGWDLVLEYALGAATVGVSWSSYLNQLLAQYNMAIPPEFSSAPAEGGIINLPARSEEHTSELQSRPHLVCRLLLEKKKKTKNLSTNI